jgi:hypothetical protein
MNKRILARTALSAVAAVLTVAVNFAIAPTTALMSSNAALGQMVNSDTSYVAAVAEMNFASMLAGLPGWLLLLALVTIWGSLLLTTNQ